MKAAIVREMGKPPVFGDFEEPVAGEGEVLVTVTASALSNLTRGRASGTHYSSSGKLPLIPGVDGVGKLEDGRRVFFALPRGPFGGMAERTLIGARQCVPIPDDLDDVTAAAIANPGMSSWAALKERAKLVAGETVLVNGATGTSGRLAVQIAKHLGAGRVIATGRNPAVLEELKTIGADATVQLSEDAAVNEAAFKEHFAGGVHVVLDYLWGASAQALLGAAARADLEEVPTRFVQIGNMSGVQITLAAPVLRSIDLKLMGSGIGSVPMKNLLGAIGELLAATVPGGFKIATVAHPLADVEKVWATAGNAPRVVFTV